jgi:thymidylate synthase
MEQQYLDLLKHIRLNGTDTTTRTGVDTRSMFGAQLRFNLGRSFPLLTTKKLYTKGIFGELCWLISGTTNIKWLQDRNIHIWDEWADAEGNLGPVYGAQWRAWQSPLVGEIDQLQEAANLIRRQPDSRRIIVSAWNPGEIHEMALPPCHAFFQFEVHSDGQKDRLSCHLYQRSADMFLGVPFNIASYAALTHYMAWSTGLDVGELIISFGDIHVYHNHFDAVDEQLLRRPHPAPQMEFKPGKKPQSPILEVPDISDFVVTGYVPYPAIKAEVAV